MKLTKIKRIENIGEVDTYDITVKNNSNFFCNNHLIHNCGYRGEIKVLLVNLINEEFTWDKGERIAQGVIAHRISSDYGDLIEVAEINESERGEGGFGSTGTK